MIQRALRKNSIKKFLSSKVFLFFIVLALIGLTINVGRESYRKYQLTKEINSLKSETERIEGKNQQLTNLLEYFKEESYLEKEARLKLNLKKPGEKIVVISGDKNQDTARSPELVQENTGMSALTGEDPAVGRPLESNLEESNFWKWWEYFFTP